MHETYDSEIKRLAPPKNFPVRLGIIGGGQLARMTAIAALPLGCEVIVLEKIPFSPAARLSPDSIVGDWSDAATLRQFAARCDVITLENEFVDAAALEVLEQAGHKVFPSAACLAVTQDKYTQKQALKNAGLAVPKFCAVNLPGDIQASTKMFGWPLGNPLMLAPTAVMVNLLGTEKASGEPRGLENVLRLTGARVHIYGKLMSGAGRKMGHVTVLGNSLEDAQAIAERAAKEISFGEKL